VQEIDKLITELQTLSDTLYSERARVQHEIVQYSTLTWMFSRLSLPRFMPYLPFLSFGPSATVPGSAYLLTPPFGFRSASLALPTP
jgi:hypothetical protein